jgi:hypothetical protein
LEEPRLAEARAISIGRDGLARAMFSAARKRTSAAFGFGARQSVFHDRTDGARAAAAIGTAAEAAVNLGRSARTIGPGAETRFDGSVREDVAGADDHANP